jgi:hypothetical protein
MYLAYFDESGDSGLVGSPTKFFVLSCVLVHQDDWLATRWCPLVVEWDSTDG